MAIVVAGATLADEGTWLLDWLIVDVLYKIGTGIIRSYMIEQLNGYGLSLSSSLHWRFDTSSGNTTITDDPS